MTTKEQSLERLIERVKAATGADRELDIAIGTTIGGWTYQPHVPHNFKWNDGGFDRPGGPPSYTASIDAALALVERLRPRLVIKFTRVGDASGHLQVIEAWDAETGDEYVDEWHPDEPRPGPLSILAALLQALKETSHDHE